MKKEFYTLYVTGNPYFIAGGENYAYFSSGRVAMTPVPKASCIVYNPIEADKLLKRAKALLEKQIKDIDRETENWIAGNKDWMEKNNKQPDTMLYGRQREAAQDQITAISEYKVEIVKVTVESV